jgi:diguanylate cyclase (GGDEF)-like protein
MSRKNQRRQPISHRPTSSARHDGRLASQGEGVAAESARQDAAIGGPQAADVPPWPVHSPRTDLYPRIDLAIDRATARGSKTAALIVDLDRFDIVKDSLGRETADRLLASVSERLRGKLPDADLLERLGDAFFVLSEDTSAEQANALAGALIGALADGFPTSVGQDVYVGASVGVALFPDHGSTSQELVEHAETALHRAKSAGNGGCRLYSANLTRTASARLALDASMRRALERNELQLHYQPICALADRRVVEVEALLRWRDLDLGSVPPCDFIPLAEETGFIVPLTDWILKTACAQMKSWLADGRPLARMAVNVSAKYLRSDDVVERVGRILTETGLPGRSLELELTESALIEDTADLREKMTAIRALGPRLAIDDFGTGYSSLAYLKRLPVDKLKIDRIFVCDLPHDRTAAQIASTIVALGEALDLQIVAEGVETEGQLKFLRGRGVGLGQGHLLGPPTPAAELGASRRPRKSATRRDASYRKSSRAGR